jgi:hypothetical protein
MQMTMRWFGKDFDSVTLEQIRQVPGVTGVITTLYGKLPGEGMGDRGNHRVKGRGRGRNTSRGLRA